MEPLPKLSDNSDLMKPPRDDLSLQNQLPKSSTFEAPDSWGTQPISPPTPQTITSAPLPSITDPKNSFLKIFFIGLALILVGVLIGIVAAKITPSIPTTSTLQNKTVDITPTSEPILEDEPEVEILPAPTATPESLLKLNWKNYSTDAYRIYYPDTWTLKTNLKGLSLARGNNLLTVSSDKPTYSCDQSNIFSVDKDSYTWEIQEVSSASKYIVCGEGNSEETPFLINAQLVGKNIDQSLLDEFKYILEKIEILK